MILTEDIKERLEKAFPKKQAVVLTEVFVKFQDGLVQADDFNELKGIVKELAEAQKRTEERVEELVQAQKRTEERIEELVQAQKELALAQRRTEDELTRFRRSLDSKIGGLGARWGDNG